MCDSSDETVAVLLRRAKLLRMMDGVDLSRPTLSLSHARVRARSSY